MSRFNYDFPPVKCDMCGSNKIRYTTNDEIYGKIYGNGGCYLCDNCGAYVGVYNTKTRKPLGRLANKELREMKMACHRKFDKLWKVWGFRRTDCYKFLSYKLDLSLRETHFGWFDKEYLVKAIHILDSETLMEELNNFTKISYMDFERYLKVQSSGLFNMFDPRAREQANLGEDRYFFIISNYEMLMKKFKPLYEKYMKKEV